MRTLISQKFMPRETGILAGESAYRTSLLDLATALNSSLTATRAYDPPPTANTP